MPSDQTTEPEETPNGFATSEELFGLEAIVRRGRMKVVTDGQGDPPE